MVSNNFNIEIINDKINKDNFSEISQLTNDILNKNYLIDEKNNINNRKKIKQFLTLIIFFFIIILLIYCPISNNYYKNKLKTEIIRIEEYFKICDNGILLNKKNINKKLNPKVSIISAVYNKQNYILRFLRSIQNQNYENIEIILIDDFSDDNTVNLIEKYQKEDKRIILIKHKKNKGTLISRNEGIIISRGAYILIPDSDDMLTSDIINQCLIIEEEIKYDMIRFNTYLGNKNIFMKDQIKYLINKSIYQPELSFYIFYGLGNLKIIDPMISNKFVKRNILINALNLINDYFLNQNMIFYEDTLINFLIYKVSKSYYFLNNIGYFYISNPNSSTMNYIKNDITINRILKSFFLFLKFIFEYTKNSKYEKDMGNEVIKKEIEVFLNSKIYNKLNRNFQFYEKIINLYLHNKYIHYSIKIRLNNIKKMLKEKSKKKIS